MRLNAEEKDRIVWALEREVFKWGSKATQELLADDIKEYKISTLIESEYQELANRFKPKGSKLRHVPAVVE